MIRRRDRGHPWLWMVAIGTAVTALLAGDGAVALVMFGVSWLLVIW